MRPTLVLVVKTTRATEPSAKRKRAKKGAAARWNTSREAASVTADEDTSRYYRKGACGAERGKNRDYTKVRA